MIWNCVRACRQVFAGHPARPLQLPSAHLTGNLSSANVFPAASITFLCVRLCLCVSKLIPPPRGRWRGVSGAVAENCPYRACVFVGGADPGLHPGLMELALQAEIAGGQWEVGSGKWEVPGLVPTGDKKVVQAQQSSMFSRCCICGSGLTERRTWRCSVRNFRGLAVPREAAMPAVHLSSPKEGTAVARTASETVIRCIAACRIFAATGAATVPP